jgi:hypothetical protein
MADQRVSSYPVNFFIPPDALAAFAPKRTALPFQSVRRSNPDSFNSLPRSLLSG